MKPIRIVALPVLLCATGCMSLQYDLGAVPFAVSASPAPKGARTEPFVATGKSVLWVHGLLGDSQADVATLVKEAVGDCAGVANFRVASAASFHDWFLTHLTLGLVRMKTVTVTGDRLRH
ncbi:MAG: hypothetical protein JNK78_19505 [Planctomycetes bacterium]|nr:hypothetical protein [Planctomycetota bacterium]